MNQTATYNLLSDHSYLTGAATESLKERDYELARAAAKGVIAALGELYDRHSRRVYSLCLRMTRNATEAEDLTQEIFLQLLRQIGSFRGESQFTTWLYRLTFNHVLMHFRRRSARKDQTPEDVEAVLQVSQRYETSPGTEILDRIALDAALVRLPPGCRAVFVLFYIEGYKHDEIAKILGCTAGNSKSQLYKAKMKMRRLLVTGNLKRRKSSQSPTA